MDASARAMVEAIHGSPTQAVLYLSGGASQALGWLISVPGASNTVLEAVVPYSRMSMVQLLGKVPAQFASRQTAEDMALMAYNRALKLSQLGYPVLGVGFTGSLASTCPKLGHHRFHVSTRTCNRLWASSVTLSKGLRTREQEDRVSSQFLLKVYDVGFGPRVTALRNISDEEISLNLFGRNLRAGALHGTAYGLVERFYGAIAYACKIPATFDAELTDSETPDEYEMQFDEVQELEQLINGQICFKVYPFLSDMSKAERKIILSGSFNPLHSGHLKLLEVATSILGEGYPCFELSAVNADKPPLTVSQIKQRVRQFENVGKTVIISNQPYFYRKAELFPGSAFVIGADTAVRLINPKYYGGDRERMVEVLSACKSTGCIFLVGGRNVDGEFKVIDDFEVPTELRDMFIPIPAEKFRMDISSTEIRRSQGSL